MSPRKHARVGGGHTPGKRADVGYGRPPIEHQFKPGQSGNKRGRLKGSKNEATIIAELLSRKIEIRENGKARKISLLEAIFLKFAEDALRGNPKAAAFLLNRKLLLESSEQPATAVLDVDDEKVLHFYARQLGDQSKKQQEQK
jgi:hypothetical protein